MPASTTTMSSPYSNTVMFLPISSSPPSGMTRRRSWFCDIGRTDLLSAATAVSRVARAAPRSRESAQPHQRLVDMSETVVPSPHYGADDPEGTRQRGSAAAKGMRGALGGPLPPIWTGAIPATRRSPYPLSDGRIANDRRVACEAAAQARSRHGGEGRHVSKPSAYAGRTPHPTAPSGAGTQPRRCPAERPRRCGRWRSAAGVPRSRLVSPPQESDSLLRRGACLARLLFSCDRQRTVRRSIFLRAVFPVERPRVADGGRSRALARRSTHGNGGLAPLGRPAFHASTVGLMLTGPVAVFSKIEAVGPDRPT